MAAAGGGERLRSCVCDGDVEAVRQLLDAGADVHAVDGEGRTALHFAAAPDQGRFFELLMVMMDMETRARGADVHAVRNDGRVARPFAADDDVIAIAKLLVARGADVDARNEEGQTPLHLALSYIGSAAVAEPLMELGANVNVKDNDGRTPLHDAVDRCNTRAAYCLLEHGAVANIGDNEGLTPIDLAANPEHPNPEYDPEHPDDEWGVMDVNLIVALLRSCDALPSLARRMVDAYEERLRRASLALAPAVRSPAFLSDLAALLASLNGCGCAPGPRLEAVGRHLDAVGRQLDAHAQEEDGRAP